MRLGVPAVRAVGVALAGALAAAGPAAQGRASSPHDVVETLLATDRTFAAASARTTMVPALSAMFAKDVTMPVPRDGFAVGSIAVAAALRRNADHATARVDWLPIRGGISADGRHGFTFGYMTQKLPNDTAIGFKYMAYWIRQPQGWRVVGYKRRQRPEGPISMQMMAPVLPAALVTTKPDNATLAQYHESLDRAERAFSTEAQRIGIGPAFAKYGAVDAVNMGGPKDAAFIVGAEAIAQSVAAGYPPGQSPVEWSPDKVIVASSGDVGITFGMIRPHAPGPDGKSQAGIPFFTIWRRASLADPWRYIAE